MYEYSKNTILLHYKNCRKKSNYFVGQFLIVPFFSHSSLLDQAIRQCLRCYPSNHCLLWRINFIRSMVYQHPVRVRAQAHIYGILWLWPVTAGAVVIDVFTLFYVFENFNRFLFYGAVIIFFSVESTLTCKA